MESQQRHMMAIVMGHSGQWTMNQWAHSKITFFIFCFEEHSLAKTDPHLPVWYLRGRLRRPLKYQTGRCGSVLAKECSSKQKIKKVILECAHWFIVHCPECPITMAIMCLCCDSIHEAQLGSTAL